MSPSLSLAAAPVVLDAKSRSAGKPAAGRVLALLAMVAMATLLTGWNAEASHSVVRHYSSHDGIPQLQVISLRQDPIGYLWVGTQTGGVARYDGRRWEVFDADRGLPGGAVYALALSPAGTLYAGTSGGAARFDGGRWEPLGSPSDAPSPPVKAIAIGSDGRLWLGTPAGLLTRAQAGSPPVPVRATAVSLGGAEISSLEAGPDGSLWVGTSKGLARVAAGKEHTLEPVAGLPDGAVRCLLARKGLPLLVSITGAGLFEGSPGRFRRIGDDERPGHEVNALAANATNPTAVWIGTNDQSAFRWDGERLEPFGPGQGMKETSIYAILQDREGLIWFGGDGGLWKRAPAAFVTLDAAEGIPDGASVYGMAESADRSKWLVLFDFGLVRMEEGGSFRIYPPKSFDGRPTDVAAAPGGGVLVVSEGGLFRIDGERISKVALPKDAPRSFRMMLLLRKGGLALGTSTTGLVVVKGKEVWRAPPPIGKRVNALFEVFDGTIWAGGEGWGAVALKDGVVTRRIGARDGLPSNQVNGITVDSRGILWIATDRGAYRRDPAGETRILDRRNGLPDSFVYWIHEDSRKGIWIGTNRGVARLLPDGSIENYSSRQGLGSDECNEDGFLVDSRGRVYIGNAGVSIFAGQPVLPAASTPNVVVEEVLSKGKAIPGLEEVVLPAGGGPVTFRFAALSFVDEGSVRFRYRLSGLSESWTDSEPRQFEVTYGALPAGRFLFEVTARTGDGRTSASPARVAFTVRPRWWRTPEFLLAALAAIVLLSSLAVHVRERALQATRRRLEAEVAERTEDLRRANDRLADLAVRDDLTGLANRRRIVERLVEGIALARRQGTPFCVALADIDGFKEINDRLGHAEGDRYLCVAARAMEGVTRGVDLLGRYGGDEFLILLPGSDDAGAVAASERIRQAVLPLVQETGTADCGSISIGLAALDESVADGSELIHRADVALYEAKRGGRNRVVAWKAV